METSSSTSKEHKRRRCCISHTFSEAASTNLHRIAVVHPSPSLNAVGVRIAVAANNPPVYEGDKCFTYADVAKAVEFLSSRLRSILDGADDPYLMKPQVTSERKKHDGRESFLPSFIPNEEQIGDSKTMYVPKIIGIYMPPSVEYVVSVLTVLRIGKAFLPLDPRWPRDRVLSVISSSNVDLVISSQSCFGKGGYKELGGPFWITESSKHPLFCFSMEESIREGASVSELICSCENEKQRLFCYVMYTSGSTGEPKCVCGTEEGLINRFLWMHGICPYSKDEVLLFKTSISFIDHLQEFLGAILSASTLIIPPFNKLTDYPFSIIKFLQAYSVNRLTAVPSLMRIILSAFQGSSIIQIQTSLKLLILSGEVFPLSLWEALSNLLPKTTIMNLYGSTEVSGDCTYFDCKRLPMILEEEALSSVPIGVPISGCDVVIIGETDSQDEGEIYVGGICLSRGFLSRSHATTSGYVKLHENSICNCSGSSCRSRVYYRTGDCAQRLQSGDLLFLGRKDRTVKINGQKISLEEIENTIMIHPHVSAAAVVHRQGPGELSFLQAFLSVVKEKPTVKSSIKSWVASKLPAAVIPNDFIVTGSLPLSASGKVDYGVLASSLPVSIQVQEEIAITKTNDYMQSIKRAFCDALVVVEVSDDDDFFMIGGNSVSAAHVCYNLGIDMKLLYNFPTPSKLFSALLNEIVSGGIDIKSEANRNVNVKEKGDFSHFTGSAARNLVNLESNKRPSKNPYEKQDGDSVAKRLKVDLEEYICSKASPSDGNPWCPLMSLPCAISRSNKVMKRNENKFSNSGPMTSLVEIPTNAKNLVIQELWKVHMESCVDASPLIVFKELEVYMLIGSHAHKFKCINAKNGSVLWEVVLEGRIECSAAIVGDFSQVVVGCYKGLIYFLDFSNGERCWSFQTSGEVKCQPMVDTRRELVWCGSHDHNLYALDYKNHCCVCKIPCGGSIFGSPAFDEVDDTLYVASTSGRVTAISLKLVPFSTLWQHELKVPVFGSLSMSSPGGNVDGHVTVLDRSGSIVWRSKTTGPIFAGPCLSYGLPSQVLICSRDGFVYSFNSENGFLLWKYDVHDPITASAFVDEQLLLTSDPSISSDRLICVCTSSGTMHLLHVNMKMSDTATQFNESVVQEFAKLTLPGDIFSSPVMIGGRIFVGCRDDFAHCVAFVTKNSDEE